MYKVFLVLLAAFLLGATADAQTMQWVPGDQVDDASYTDGTNCQQNVLCYALTYTPAQTGVLTSYTTNFLVDCDAGNSAVVSNVSLTMTDNSAQQTACEEAGMLLLHASANSGELAVKAERTTVLHEICIQTSRRTTELRFSADEVGGMTTSLDRREALAVTERPAFAPFLFKRDRAACPESPATTFAGGVDNPGDLSGEMDGTGLSLSPNPADVEVNVRFDHDAPTAQFRLLDATGKELRRWKGATATTLRLDVSRLPAGLYYLSASTEDDNAERTERFVVRR